MCCCVGKCPVGSQKTILSYAPIADRVPLPFSCMNAESDTKKMGLALSDIHYIEVLSQLYLFQQIAFSDL